MKRATIRAMICPYCLGSFSIAMVVKGSSTHIEYGLVKCGCFEFPIIEGVLMLALSKGYGGAEESLQPYVALQTAAITMIKRCDIVSLERWIETMAPLVGQLCAFAQKDLTYSDYIDGYNKQLRRAVASYLRNEHRYGVLGSSKYGQSNTDNMYDNWYYLRFITPRAVLLRKQLHSLFGSERILSLCCGHGIVEHHLTGQAHGSNIVSVDGQLINLLVIRKFINPSGDFICHDLQFALPFRDGYFRSSVSSTCVPEIPSHAAFIKEAVRVTSADGCALFDSIWATPSRRIDPLRYYRFCQNEFESKETILDLLLKCSDGRPLELYSPQNGSGVEWASKNDVNRVLRDGTDPCLSAMIGKAYRAQSSTSSFLCQADIKRLHLTPLYKIVGRTTHTLYVKREPRLYGVSLVPPEPGILPERFSIETTSLTDWSYVTTLVRRGVLSVLPRTFGSNTPSLRALRRP